MVVGANLRFYPFCLGLHQHHCGRSELCHLYTENHLCKLIISYLPKRFSCSACRQSKSIKAVCVCSNHAEEHHKSIFARCETKQGFRLKENVQFHLYISTSPCGDARIFSPHEAGVEGEPLCDEDLMTRSTRSSRRLCASFPIS